jgi:hypothetical protein
MTPHPKKTQRVTLDDRSEIEIKVGNNDQRNLEISFEEVELDPSADPEPEEEKVEN